MTNRFQELRDKEVIHVCEGARLGYVNDLVVDICCGRVTALIVPGAVPVSGTVRPGGRLCDPVAVYQTHRRRSNPGRWAAFRVADAAQEAEPLLSR